MLSAFETHLWTCAVHRENVKIVDKVEVKALTHYCQVDQYGRERFGSVLNAGQEQGSK